VTGAVGALLHSHPDAYLTYVPKKEILLDGFHSPRIRHTREPVMLLVVEYESKVLVDELLDEFIWRHRLALLLRMQQVARPNHANLLR
jgi:hypothetical protein